MKPTLMAVITCGLVGSLAQAADQTELKDPKAKLSYSLGLSIGNSYKRQGVEFDLDLLNKGIKDALAGGETILTENEARDVIMAFQQERRAQQEEKRKKQGDLNKQESETFLAANKQKPGVISLPSGLQYKVIKEGTGPVPTVNDTVTALYRGTLIDGTEFDSTQRSGKPYETKVTGVIRGWTEALQKMKVGSKWQLYIPPDLAYGERGYGQSIAPHATLIFDLELAGIKAPEISQPVTSDIIKVPSAEELKKGAQIEIIKQPKPGDK